MLLNFLSKLLFFFHTFWSETTNFKTCVNWIFTKLFKWKYIVILTSFPGKYPLILLSTASPFVCIFIKKMEFEIFYSLSLFLLLQHGSDCTYFCVCVCMFRLLQNLPVCNLDILRQLFSCLHEISKQASFNLMSAPKLAFCITTSIFPLWTSTSNLESELLKKVMRCPIPIVMNQFLRW